MQKPADSLIWSRTAEDVLAALQLDEKIGKGKASKAEKDSYLAEKPGALFPKDLNRIEQYTAYLSEKLLSFGYLAKIKKRKGSWRLGEGLRKSDLMRMRKNILELRLALLESGMKMNWRKINLEDPLTFEKINDMEFNLSAIDGAALALEKAMIYAGEINAGEEW